MPAMAAAGLTYDVPCPDMGLAGAVVFLVPPAGPEGACGADGVL